MSTIMPQSEMCKKAVAWISDQLRETGKPLAGLVEEAAMRFNLGPKDCEFLQRFFAEQRD